MAMGTNRPGGAISDINVTPLVDVMLVLLIIFMIAAPMIEKKKITKQKVTVDLPRTDAESVDMQQDRKMILEIKADGKIYVKDLADDKGDVQIADCGPERGLPYHPARGGCMEAVEQKLGANVKLQQDREIYLLADRQVPYGTVVGVMARLKKAGVDKLGMVTDPYGGPGPEEGGPPAGGAAQ